MTQIGIGRAATPSGQQAPGPCLVAKTKEKGKRPNLLGEYQMVVVHSAHGLFFWQVKKLIGTWISGFHISSTKILPHKSMTPNPNQARGT